MNSHALQSDKVATLEQFVAKSVITASSCITSLVDIWISNENVYGCQSYPRNGHLCSKSAQKR